jgi:hypothetical protein
MIFSPCFYYTAIVLNIFLRFFFLVMIAFMVEPGNESQSFPYKFRLWFVLSMVAECVRRTIWCILRMENEQCNNFESYRKNIYIPALDEDSSITFSFGKKDLVD